MDVLRGSGSLAAAWDVFGAGCCWSGLSGTQRLFLQDFQRSLGKHSRVRLPPDSRCPQSVLRTEFTTVLASQAFLDGQYGQLHSPLFVTKDHSSLLPCCWQTGAFGLNDRQKGLDQHRLVKLVLEDQLKCWRYRCQVVSCAWSVLLWLSAVRPHQMSEQ